MGIPVFREQEKEGVSAEETGRGQPERCLLGSGHHSCCQMAYLTLRVKLLNYRVACHGRINPLTGREKTKHNSQASTRLLLRESH